MTAAQAGTMEQNAATLDRELAWLSMLIDAAIQLYLGNPCKHGDVREIAPPDLIHSSAYATVVRDEALSFDQRVLLALAIAPHIRPQIFDPFFVKNPNIDRGFTEFGGIVAGSHNGFLPTLETAAFILSGPSLERRFAVQSLLEPRHLLRRRKLLQGDEPQGSTGPFAMPLVIGKEYLGLFTTGSGFRPSHSNAFPARLLTTPQDWSDLVLNENTMDEVEEIRAWIEHREELLNGWQLAKKIKPGFRSLFYGPPGTGKTFTVSLLGKATGLDVYRVDLSLVVSKWIGETEKNLAGVFDQAENHNWILFFDEADALFGKRTQTSSAHDRYANQEVAYLLQRVEDSPGVVILATNLKSNIDDAFARRFQSMIFFPVPEPAERLRLWRGAFADTSRLDDSIDLEQLASEFELSGGGIMNVLRYASLMALRRGSQKVLLQDVRQGIRREFRKVGKAL